MLASDPDARPRRPTRNPARSATHPPSAADPSSGFRAASAARAATGAATRRRDEAHRLRWLALPPPRQGGDRVNRGGTRRREREPVPFFRHEGVRP